MKELGVISTSGNDYAITCLLQAYSVRLHKSTFGSLEYPITGLFHSGRKHDFYSLPSSPFSYSLLEEPSFTLTKISPQKHSQSAAISRTLRLRHSSPSSKSLEEVEYLDVLTETGKKIDVSKPSLKQLISMSIKLVTKPAFPSPGEMSIEKFICALLLSFMNAQIN